MTLPFSSRKGSSSSSTSMQDVPLEHLVELFYSPAKQALFDLEGRLLVQRLVVGGGRGQQPLPADTTSSGQRRSVRNCLYQECLCRLRGNLLLIGEVKPGNSCDNNISHDSQLVKSKRVAEDCLAGTHQKPLITVLGSSLALVILHRFEIKLIEGEEITAKDTGPRQFEFVLTINSAGNKSTLERYHFIAASRGERDTWIQNIYLASFDFLKSIHRALRETLYEERAKARHSITQVRNPFSTQQGHNKSFYAVNASSTNHHHFLTLKCTSALCQLPSTVDPYVYVKVFYRLLYIDRSWRYLARTEAIASRSPLFAGRITLPFSGGSEAQPSVELKFELIKSAYGELDNAFLVAYAYAQLSSFRRRKDFRKSSAFSVALISVDGGQSRPPIGQLQITLHHRTHSTLGHLRSCRSLESLLLPSSHFSNSLHLQKRRKSSSVSTLFLEMDHLRSREHNDGSSASSNIFSKTIYKRFSFKVPAAAAGTGSADLLLEEFMSESKFAFSIPQILMKLYAHDEEKIIAALEQLRTEASPEAKRNTSSFFEPLLTFHRTWLASIKDYLGEIIHFMAENSFRPSKNKTEPCLQFVPTNFHKQSCRAVVIGGENFGDGQTLSSSSSPFFTLFTHGAYSAHHLGYDRNGGMQSLMSGKNESLVVIDCWRTLKGKLLVVLHTEARITAALNSVALLQTGNQDNDHLPLTEVEPIYRSVRKLCDDLGVLLSVGDVEEQLAMLAGLESAQGSSASLLDGVFYLEPLELVYVNIQASLLGIEHKLEEGRAVGVIVKAELDSFNRKLKGAIESLRRIVLACYLSTFSQLNRKREEDKALERLRFRHQALCSQVVTTLVIFIMDRLADPVFLATAARTGFILVQHEVWLSCFQDELGMLEDMVYALAETADRLEVVFAKGVPGDEACDGFQPPTSMPTIETVGEKLRLTFHLSEEVLLASSSFECRVKSIIFNIGVNEAATVAERLGYNSFQRQLNRDNFAKLKAFCRRFYPDDAQAAVLLSQLEEEIVGHRSNAKKNLRVMELVEGVVRRVGGIRATCCKSAKDRTGMSVTLQEVRFATSFAEQVLGKGLSKNEKLEKEMLEAIRRDGTRLECCFKNIGVRKYAFNRIQLATYPRKFRPPKGTYYNTVLESSALT